jgi:hypothetical protein
MQISTACKPRRSKKLSLEDISSTRDDSSSHVSVSDFTTFGISSKPKPIPVDNTKDYNYEFEVLYHADVQQEAAKCMLQGRILLALDYFNSNPTIYRKRNPDFFQNSEGAYLVGRCFLTNQPIFREFAKEYLNSPYR